VIFESKARHVKQLDRLAKDALTNELRPLFTSRMENGKKNSRPENPDSDQFHWDRFIATNVIEPCRQLSRFQEITFLIRGSLEVDDTPDLFRMDGSPILLMTDIPTFSKSTQQCLRIREQRQKKYGFCEDSEAVAHRIITPFSVRPLAGQREGPT
jgi:hypothetical protein